jgi:hypothetical protein
LDLKEENTFYIHILFSNDESCIVRKGGLIIRLLFLPRRLIFLLSQPKSFGRRWQLYCSVITTRKQTAVWCFSEFYSQKNGHFEQAKVQPV